MFLILFPLGFVAFVMLAIMIAAIVLAVCFIIDRVNERRNRTN